MIYFDQAASSWPKPPQVSEKMKEVVDSYAANPGRGGHELTIKASECIRLTRQRLATLFNVKQPRNIIFTHNATFALNQAIKGLHWNEGDEIVTTTYEHNSVRRPLINVAKTYGVHIHYVTPNLDGDIDLIMFERMVCDKTKLVVINHISNVTGAILPLKSLAEIAQKKGALVLVDASQSAGIIPIDVEELAIDMLAFPGHKGLYGPQGTGGLYISPNIDLLPLLHGGTGHHSEEEDQPNIRPEKYEAGTLNTPGIAGLGEGVQFVLEQGVENIRAKEWEITSYALKSLQQIEEIEVYGPSLERFRGPVISFNMKEVQAQELATILDQHYQIATRAGMHCSPLGHQSINTEAIGAVRISFGMFNTIEEVDQLMNALKEIKEGLLG